MPTPTPDRSVVNSTTAAFGERVRSRRQELGLSQEAAAQRCGIHWTQFGKVERGQRSLRLETIVRIADGLAIDAGQLVSGLPLPEWRGRDQVQQ
ncbi:helix-turn-helix domain-containing protein [Mycobacterium sp. pW049]|uniref:helix-turn-helix domain-containing protein n=1 Tax=[Mycobacterium] bulgaricum TaxID=3238985 RepID=UPI00351AFB49